MPKISSYNPSILVAGTGEVIQIQLDDWYDNKEILAKLSKLYSAKTVRGLVKKIKSDAIPAQTLNEGILKVSVENCTENECPTLALDPNELIAEIKHQ